MGNTYYVMTPIDDNTLIIDIPTDNRMGFLRDIISPEEAEKLIEKIPEITPLENINEKYIEAQYKEMNFSYDEINSIAIKLQLEGLDLNKRKNLK